MYGARSEWTRERGTLHRKQVLYPYESAALLAPTLKEGPQFFPKGCVCVIVVRNDENRVQRLHHFHHL